jgi:branched-chain amino acid aminotransferase
LKINRWGDSSAIWVYSQGRYLGEAESRVSSLTGTPIAYSDPMPAVVDGVLVDESEARISIFDDGLMRGDGVFEVVRLYRGLPWALDEHLERMAQSGRGLRLEIEILDFLADVALLLASIGEIDAFVRLVQTRGGRRISTIEELGTSVSSVALATIEHAPSPMMAGIKSLSYAPNMLAVRLAEERGGADALFVTPDGVVLEASRASFFYVINDELYTPPLGSGTLDSITRRYLVRLTGAGERLTTRYDLDELTEAFIASTRKEVLPVHAIDGRSLQAPGPLTLAADAAYASCVGREQRRQRPVADPPG